MEYQELFPNRPTLVGGRNPICFHRPETSESEPAIMRFDWREAELQMKSLVCMVVVVMKRGAASGEEERHRADYGA
jgi:hypothetical protein